jgi:toxin ParE1/3/4
VGYRFSRRAERDLLEIGAYTLRTWGEEQAARYIDDLEACCKMLARTPALGRSCADIHIHPGLRRMERGRHVIFYRQEAKDIVVSRILHRRMLPKRHVMDEEER